jgi:AcrR family transcriptional regulator
MSPRKPAVLRQGADQSLRDYLITTAARLIDQRGTAGLAVRDIAREAQVADGVLYNYFEDKEDLLAHALLAHVGRAMGSLPPMPAAGTGTVQENLRLFIEHGLAVLVRVIPAFAGLLSQPKVLSRFHALVGGDAAFGMPNADGDAAGRDDAGGPPGRDSGPADGGPRGLHDVLSAYLLAEQRAGRIGAGADVDSAVTLIVGAMHGQVLPRVLLSVPDSGPIIIPGDLAGKLAATLLAGIAP